MVVRTSPAAYLRSNCYYILMRATQQFCPIGYHARSSAMMAPPGDWCGRRSVSCRFNGIAKRNECRLQLISIAFALWCAAFHTAAFLSGCCMSRKRCLGRHRYISCRTEKVSAASGRLGLGTVPESQD